MREDIAFEDKLLTLTCRGRGRVMFEEVDDGGR